MLISDKTKHDLSKTVAKYYVSSKQVVLNNLQLTLELSNGLLMETLRLIHLLSFRSTIVTVSIGGSLSARVLSTR